MAASDDLPPTESETESADSFTESLHQLETRIARLNDRIQGIEDSVTDEAFQDRFDNLE
jgi:hypothetical protein